MTPAQIAFLALHVKRTILQWQWHLKETQLRASAAKRTATLGKWELLELLDADLMREGEGVSVAATAAGRLKIAELDSAAAREAVGNRMLRGAAKGAAT